MASIVIKGLSIAFIVHFFEVDHYPDSYKIMLVISLFSPQLIMSLSSTTGGFSMFQTLKFICHHADLILLPVGILNCKSEAK